MEDIDALIREMHGDVKVLGVTQALQLQEAVKTNARVSKLEKWRERILGAGALMVLGSPVFIYGVTQWFSQLSVR